jgi:hypothetical protein
VFEPTITLPVTVRVPASVPVEFANAVFALLNAALADNTAELADVNAELLLAKAALDEFADALAITSVCSLARMS